MTQPPDTTLAARLAELERRIDNAEMYGDPTSFYARLDLAVLDAYRSGQLITLSAHTEALQAAIDAALETAARAWPSEHGNCDCIECDTRRVFAGKIRALITIDQRTDLSQASVAAALEAAAGKCDAIAAFRQKQLDDDEDKHWQDQDAIMKRAWKMSISGLEAAATAIRALITPAQHDALAAHVAAEVAKARAVAPLVWKDAAPFFGDEPDSVLYSEAVGAGYTYVAEAVDCTIEEAKAEQEKAYTDNIMSALAQIGAKP